MPTAFPTPTHFTSLPSTRRRTLRYLSGALAALLGFASVPEAEAAFVRATGKLVYKDGGLKPLGDVPVRLLDDDVDFSDEIDAGITSYLTGGFELSGTATDPWLGKNRLPDPYLSVVLDDGRVDVRNIIGVSYSGETSVRRNTAGHVDYGTLLFPERPAANLFSRARRQYVRFILETGEHRVPGNSGKVAVVVPALTFGVPYTTVNAIKWAGDDEDWDAMFHEFGHRLRHAADGRLAHFLFDVARFGYARFHTPHMETNEGFAFNEGWAEYHATLLDPHEAHRVANDADLPAGDDVEGKVAYKLYALADACGGFKPLWKTLKGAGHGAIHSFAEFHAEFIRRYPSCQVNLAPHPVALLPPQSTKPRSPVSLAAQQGAVRRLLDDIDARGRQAQWRPKYSPQDLASLKPAVADALGRVQASRIRHAQGWDATSREAHRRIVLAIKPMTEASLADESHEQSLQAARDAFVGELAGARLKQVVALQREIAAERQKSRDPRLDGYLAKLAGKYADHEAELRKALASRGKEDLSVPLSIVPRTFASRLIPQKTR